MSDKFDTIQTSLTEVCAQLRNLQREHTTLKKENAELTKELVDTRADLIELKQYTRQNNIEIKGLPHDPSERPEAIIQVLGEKLGTKIETAEIDVYIGCLQKKKERQMLSSGAEGKLAARTSTVPHMSGIHEEELPAQASGLHKRQLAHLSQDRPYDPVVIEVNQQEEGTPPISRQPSS
ncbi:hypothetical protein HPB49_007959 [Dermacentor silvarum]|uniref:Uncharacterized protein n=1 Tax=Dermacentor silvarum TaxID=543639 RepID=A0ACB8DWS1_DERSI|nr:hypothetical protein HPB49_007959 [Dermacentor silvarum]